MSRYHNPEKFHKPKSIVDRLRILQLKIPKGNYCYDHNGNCPFWDALVHAPDQEDGYCHYLQRGDQQVQGGLLWDQVKECGINE